MITQKSAMDQKSLQKHVGDPFSLCSESFGYLMAPHGSESQMRL